MPWPKGVKRGSQAGKRKPRAANGKPLPPTTRVAIVAELFELARCKDVSGAELGRRMGGKSRVVLSRWKHGWGTPNAGDIERMAAALGCRLKLEEV